MASIIKRGKKYSVVYYIKNSNGKREQKWDRPVSTMKEAKKRKLEIEYQLSSNTYVPPAITTVRELLEEFVSTYGKNNWSVSTYTARKGLIKNYINPLIGDMKIQKINPKYIDDYYNRILPSTPAVPNLGKTRSTHMVSKRNIIEINKILSRAFKEAVRWQYITQSPIDNAILPKPTPKEEIWLPDTIKKAIDACENKRLELFIHLAFACSLRVGEICALTWDCINLSEETDGAKPNLFIEKTLKRLSQSDLEEMDSLDVYKVFPPKKVPAKTLLVLKKPKTDSSVRKVWIPKTVVQVIKSVKEEQDYWRELLGNEFIDNNLLLTLQDGSPIEPRLVEKWFNKLIIEHDLPKVVFHSLRHSSTTYKLKFTKDIKAVQGDTGHSQSKMVTDVYSHIIDEDRKRNAEVFDSEFYDNKPLDNEIKPDSIDKLKELLESSPDILNHLLQLVSGQEND